MDRLYRIFAAIVCVAGISLYGAQGGESAEKMRFDCLNVTDGLSQMSVVTIIQDSEGFMWFGTRDGLNRYDGYEFKVFVNDLHDSTTISDNYIKCAVNDSEGRLWVGTTNGVNLYCPETGSFRHWYIDREDHTGNTNEINSLCADSAGGVWVGTYRGLYHISPDDGSGLASEIGAFPGYRIYSMASDGSNLYIGHDRGLSMLSPDGSLLDMTETDRQKAVNLVFVDSGGTLRFCLANSGTLGSIEPGTGSCSLVQIISDEAHLRNNLIRSIAEQDDGRFALGTYDGLYIYNPDGDTIESYNYSSQDTGGLSHYAVEAVYIDKENTLWVGTYAGGVNYAHAQNMQFPFYDPAQGDFSPGVLSAIAAEPSGKVLWIGSDAGGVLRFDVGEGSFEYFPCSENSSDLFKDNNVKSLHVDGTTLYVGLYTGQLYTMDTRTCRWTGVWNNPEYTAIYAMEEKGDTLLLGTYSAHGLKYLSPQGIRYYDLPSEGKIVNISQISCLCVAGEEIWVGTRSSGLYRYLEDGRLLHYTSDDGNSISGNRITTIVRDSRGQVMIGTSDGGLNIFSPDTGTFRTISGKDGLKDNTICSIVEDRSGHVWVITRTSISELADGRVARTYDHSSGIRIQEFSQGAAYITPDNTIWVGGNNGMISFNPDDLSVNDYPSPVVITSVSVNNRPLGNPGTGKIRLKHNENNITFSFSILNYIYPKRNTYKYRLEGADDGWKDAGTVREVTYANLAPGNYHFCVKGANNDGIWSSSTASVDVRIAYPAWLRWWAFLLYTLIGGQATVIKSDVIQLSVMIVGLLALFLTLIQSDPKPFSELRFELLNDQFQTSDLARFALLIGGSYIVCPMLFSRFMSARSDKSARNGAMIAVAGLIFLAILFVLIGIQARHLLPSSTPSDQVLAAVAAQQPVILQQMLFLVLISAILSSADSCLLTAATVVCNDLIRQPGIKTSRFVMCVLTVVALFLSSSGRGILDLMLMANNVYVCAVIAPVFTAVFSSRILNRPLIIGTIVLCSLMAFWAEWSEHFGLTLIAFAFSVMGTTAAAYFEPRQSPRAVCQKS